MATKDPLDFRFMQVFGDTQPAKEVLQADIISSLEFDSTGNFLAAGDRGGRVVVFHRIPNKTRRNRSGKVVRNVEYRFYHEFQSHEQDFDYLRSVDIDEKINMIKWRQPVNDSQFLLTTNDRTIKLWKIWEKKTRKVLNLNFDESYISSPEPYPMFSSSINTISSVSGIRIPRIQTMSSSVASQPAYIYSSAHSFYINSLSFSSDGQSFLSADDLRIHLWDIERTDETFNVVDLRPPVLDNVNEIITRAVFHPTDPSLFAFSTSKGFTQLCDLRESSVVDRTGLKFHTTTGISDNALVADLIGAVSDVRFSPCGQYFATRDYLNVRVWDRRKTSQPLVTIPVHDHLRPMLSKLYESESLYDKFEVDWAPNSSSLVTGGYSNNFYMLSRDGKYGMSTAASRVLPKKRKVSSSSAYGSQQRSSASSPTGMVPFSGSCIGSRVTIKNGRPQNENVSEIDTAKRIFHIRYHPKDHILAVGTLTNLYVYAVI